MKRLQESRIELIDAYLKSSKLNPELLPEILDHLACEAEEGLWDGKSFEQVYKNILEEADSPTLVNLSVDHKSLLAMDKSLNDMVFEGRNKSYGAYDLRKNYGRTVQKSVIMGVTLFALIVFFPDLYARLVPDPKPDDIAYIVEANPIDISPEQLNRMLSAPVPDSPHELTATETNAESRLPRDEGEVENIPPGILFNEKAPETKSADDDWNKVERNNSKSMVAGLRAREQNKEFLYVEQAPQYEGGPDALHAFLQANLQYPTQAALAGVQGKVFVQFTVGSDGKIENATAVKGIGFGCDEEALRVVKLMNEWVPGRQAGVPVRVRFTLPVSFQID